jgi:hypothetical protein
MREVIRDFYGKILGHVDTDSNGNKTVTNYYGKILGRYDAHRKVTVDFYNRIVANGDASVSLIYNEKK